MVLYSILGNLFVLGIVGVVLVLFRKSDKSSKSLEQVKKYATKRNEEFDLYVENKIVYLKDISISLEVQEKTGKIILDKISDEVDDLSNKIEHIEELNKKVTGYTSTMDKMLNLSKELDDRYSKLKKDSVYMESLDKKVKDGRKKLSLIEKNITDITSEFIRNNNNSINKLKEDVLSKTALQVEELDTKVNNSSMEYEQISNLINDLRDSYNSGAKNSYNSFKEELHTLVEQHRENIVNITKEGESLEEASLTEIKDKISLRSNNLTDILDEKLKSIENDNMEKISKLSMDMGNIEVIANKIQNENKQRLDSIKEQLDTQLLLLKDANSKGVMDLQEEFQVNFTEFKQISLSEIEKSKVESDDLITELNKQLEQAAEYKTEVINKYSNTEDYVGNEISDLKDRIESSIFEITRDLDNHEDKVKASALKHMDSSMNDYKDEVDRKLGELSLVSETIDSVKNSANEQIALTKETFNEELARIKNSLVSEKDKIANDIDRFKDEITKISAQNSETIDQERITLLSKVDQIKESQSSLSQELMNNEKEIRSQVAHQRENLLEGINSDITAQLTQLKEDLDGKINSFSNFEATINSAKEDLENRLSSNNNILESEYSEFKNSILERMNTEKISLSSFMELFNSEKDLLDTEITQLKEISYNNISEKLNLFEDDYFIKLKTKEEYIETETDRWKKQLDLSVNEIKDESISSIVNNMEEVNSKVNSFKESLTIDYIKFKDNIENKLESLVSNMKTEESRILSEKETFKDKIDVDMLELQQRLSSINEHVSVDSKAIKDNLARIATEQNNYISESEIFTKADFLREELKTAIGQLSANLKDVKDKSDFVSETNQKLDGLKSLTQNINNQLDSVEDKRIKIETLENRISKVLTLSDSVDEKLTRIKDAEVEVSDIQLKLRELKELQSGVNLEFNRLEKKDEILTETNKAIDSGFGHIQVIEGKLDVLKESLLPFNNQIDNIKDKLGRVEEKETKIDTAINVLSNLDQSISEMEDKIEKMDKAREWIAGVETRLNDTVRTADEQVKLMGALAQNKNSKEIKSSTNSAPDMNKREMVIRLAHNGWDADAISRTTKLSRGEVELILELSPRK
ncbi:MAG: hypothetical protein OCD02_23145 [Spirochaetaceae bacterium]